MKSCMAKITAAAFTAIFSATPVLAADVVVLDSTFASIDAGAVLSEETAISIPASGALTLIMPSGETRVVDGPYQGPIGSAQAETGSTLRAFTSGRGGETKVLGAVRAPSWDLAR